MKHIIKRYSNRKLYDVTESRYVKLKDIGSSIRNGKHIQILDHETDEDITTAMLVKVMLMQAQKRDESLSAVMLHQMIRFGSQSIEENITRAAGELNKLHRGVHTLDDNRNEDIQDLIRHVEKLEELITELTAIQE